MKKKVAFLLALSLMLGASNVPVRANTVSEMNQLGKITQEELCEVFPEYEDELMNITEQAAVNENARGLAERTVEEVVQKTTEDGSTYAVVFYEDTSYTALRYVSNPALTGGTVTKTANKYTCTGASLILTDYVWHGSKMFTVSPISFTVNKNTWDRLDEISGFATAVVEGEDGKIVNYTAQRNSHYVTENSSRKAGGHYYIAGTYLAFQVGGNSWEIIYGDSYITLGSAF